MTDRAAQTEGAARPRRPLVSRRVSPLLFAAILFAFALPFGTVSCEGPPVKFTGYQLATWQVPETTPAATTDDGANLKDAVEHRASFWALLTLGAALAGALLGVTGRRGGGVAAIVGLLGVFILIIASEPLSLDAPDVKFEDGFALTTLLYCLLAFWHAIVSIRRRSGSRALDSAVTRHDAASVR